MSNIIIPTDMYNILNMVYDFFRENGFGGCADDKVTSNCDQYAYSDACLNT